VPIYSNVDALPHHSGDEWSSLLSAQLSSPVRWKHCLLGMAAAGATRFAELGPGGVLTGMAKRTLDGARTIAVSTPDELDALLGALGTATAPAPAAIEGEHLFAVERLVVSPAAGVFARRPGLAEGTTVAVGTVIGSVGDAEVRSLFDGVLQSVVAADGERVTAHQPVAWLRTR
jgi:[acyl-carrier-protein] S-malonyltransferase